jgi:hypothetical protein
MKRTLFALALAFAAVSSAAVTYNVQDQVFLSQNGAQLGAFPDVDSCELAARGATVTATTTFTCGNAQRTILATFTPDPTCTSPQPANDAQTVACPIGATGSWTQTRTYAAASFPTCWTAGGWLPLSAPASACSPIVLAQPSGAVLDDFEGAMRTMGGHNLWDNYAGEGARAVTSVSASAAHFGKQGLLYHMTGGPAYMHFFSNDGGQWHFAHEELTSGTWSPAYNRLSFWVFTPATMPPAGSNRHRIELGTYTRSVNGDKATQNAGGNHWYHEYDPAPGVWTYVVVDDHPQHFVGGPTTDPGVVKPLADGSNYVTSLTRFYWNDVEGNAKSYPTDILFDQFQFYTEANVGDVANIASMEASYDPIAHKLHVGFARRSIGDTVYTARYSGQDINTAGFASATACGTAGVDGLGDYLNKHIECTVDLTGQPLVYIAVQKQGSSTFREIPLQLK